MYFTGKELAGGKAFRSYDGYKIATKVCYSREVETLRELTTLEGLMQMLDEPYICFKLANNNYEMWREKKGTWRQTK